MRLDETLDQYMDDSLNESELHTFINLLSSNEKIRIEARHNLDIQGLLIASQFDEIEDADLYEQVMKKIDDRRNAQNDFQQVEKKLRKRRLNRMMWILPAIASIFMLTVYMIKLRDVVDDTVDQVAPEPLARIIASENSRWLAMDPVKQLNQPLQSKVYTLLEGIVSIKSQGGSLLVFRGPAKFKLAEGEQCFMEYGEVGVKVPQDGNYHIRTPQHLFVDLGTEFSLDYSKDSTRFYTFEGQVAVVDQDEAYGSNKNVQVYKSGEGFLMDAGKRLKKLSENDHGLLQASSVHSRIHVLEHFILELSDHKVHDLDKIILHNFGDEGRGFHFYSRYFSIEVSSTDEKPTSFTKVLQGELKDTLGPQVFELRGVRAKYLKLNLGYGYQKGFLLLDECEVYNTEGKNVSESKQGGKLISVSSEYKWAKKHHGYWRAENIIDGNKLSHGKSSWSSHGEVLFDEHVTFKLPEHMNSLDRLVIYNYGQEESFASFYSKRFSVEVSDSGKVGALFTKIYEGELKPHGEAQTFYLKGVKAKYLKIKIHSGYRSLYVCLSEIQLLDQAGNNVALSENGTKIISYSSSRSSKQGDLWSVDHLIDDITKGARGSWSSRRISPLKSKNEFPLKILEK